MRPRSGVRANVVSIVLIGAALAAPIVAAVSLARSQALDSERKQVVSNATSVLERTVEMSDEAESALRQLAALTQSGTSPCSTAAVALMRRIDLAASYIQAVGAVSGNTLTCSSIGSINADMGPAAVVTPRGVRVRDKVRFAFATDSAYLVLEEYGFAVVASRTLLLGSTDGIVAIFSPPTDYIDVATETVPPAWLSRLRDAYPSDPTHPVALVTSFRSQGYLVSVTTSSSRYAGAIAALPVSDVTPRLERACLILIPIGLIAGLLLALTTSHLARRRAGFPATFRKALRRREFFLEYQPVVDLESGKWQGAEALVRWRQADGTVIPPNSFIPLVEQLGLSNQLTAEVFRLAAADIPRFALQYSQACVSINLMADDLADDQTITRITELVEKTGIVPRQLVLELTEHGLVDVALARRTIDDCHRIGVRVTIDDFGTGYSSLAYLETLGVDGLKVDKAFVDPLGVVIDPLGKAAATANVAAHIIDMATSLGLSIVAEGVERSEQADQLRRLGVSLAQGWLYSRALPLDEFIAGMANNAELTRGVWLNQAKPVTLGDAPR